MKILFFLVTLGLVSTGSFCQPTSLDLRPLSLSYGKMRDWYSAVVQDSFRTYIYLPPGYDTSTGNYPVLYLTDGDWLFTTAVSALGNLKQDYQVREPIIIAIGYGDRANKRFRDLDPDKGGSLFLRSVKEELMPWVQDHFRISQEQLLYGYSMGGKFSTFCLFQEPGLFSSVMIGAPADGGIHLIPTAIKSGAQPSSIQTKVYLGAGAYEHETVDNIDRFRVWCKDHMPGAVIQTYTAPGMNHGAAISSVLQEALRVNFATLQKEIQLPPSTLKGYAGIYTDRSDSTITSRVFLRHNELYILLRGYTRRYALRLYPLTSNSFFLKEYERNRYLFTPHGLRIEVAGGHVIDMYKK